MRGSADGVTFVFPADGGSKEFALTCGEPSAYAPATGLSQFCHLRRKHSDLPLEKVRHWVTDWPLPQRDRSLLYPRGSAERWEAKLRAWPELANAYRSRDIEHPAALLPTYLARGDSASRDKLFQRIHKALDNAIEHVLANGYLRLNIFDGREFKVGLEAIDLLRSRGGLDDATARSFARRIAFLAHCFADRNFWPWDSAFRARDDPRSHGEAYWDDIGDAICPPNFATEYYTSFALAALAYPEHPAAREWTARAVELFERNLAAAFYDSGGYCESVNYHAHELTMLLPLALALLAAGERDFFEHPRFKATFGFFLDMLTPRAALTPAGREMASAPTVLNPPKDDRALLLTNWGNSGHDCSGYLVPMTLAVAAGVYAERDPGYARRLMAAWRLSPQEFCAQCAGFSLLALGRPDLPGIELKLESKLVEGLGAVMRAGDVFAWIKCGKATHHNCRDEGGLVLYAHGAPLIGDFGYHTMHQGRQEGGYETWKHACVTFGGRTVSAYLGTETASPPELWRSTPEADLLVAHLPVEYLIPEGASYLDVMRVPRIEHRRFIVFVKPRYFVIYDHIPQTTLPSTWWLHALADAVEVEPQRARSRGRSGVDLDAQVLLPAPATIRAGEYSVQRHIRVEQSGAGDYLVVLSALPHAESAPQAAWNASDGVLRVASELGEDAIQFQVTPNGYEVVLRRNDRIVLRETHIVST